MTAFLPQCDPHPDKRTKQIDKAQRHYVYNYSHVSPLAMVDKVPFEDEFTFGWLIQVAESAVFGLANHLENEVDAEHREFYQAKHNLFSRLVHIGAAQAKGLMHLVQEALQFHGRLTATSHRPEGLEDYARLFRAIGLPPISREYQQDEVFAHMRVAGPNPLVIRRIDSPDDRFPVQEEHFRQALPDDSLQAAAAEGRLYLADYQALEAVENGDYPHGRKYLYAPLALFAVSKSTGKLMPVAIQCEQRPGRQTPILTPGDGYNWLIAKTIVEIADGNLHEAVSHLGRTHLFIEPFVVATHRRLAPQHPLSLLLKSHFACTLAINKDAWSNLIADRGACDKLMGGTIEATRKLVVEGVKSYSLQSALLPLNFQDRGVDDPELLPDYPYRDDAMLYWRTISQWVSDYLAIYYRSDADVQEDPELQNWWTELLAADGGRVTALQAMRSLSTREDLASLVTLLVFTASVQHAAVNFPQYDLMSYVPNFPLAGYAPAPQNKTGATEQDYLDQLPPMDVAELQTDMGYLLGTIHYTTLGHYHRHQFRDPRVVEPLKRFQQQLEDVGQQIADRNEVRRPYTYLTPAGIPQSINI